MEPFVVTLGGYIGFGVSLIIALGAIVAIRFKETGVATGRLLYILTLIVSVAIGTVLITTTGALKEVRLRKHYFDQYCQSTHITVHKTISGVRELYISHGNGCMRYLNTGYLSACEGPAYNQRIDPDKPFQREYASEHRVVDRLKEPQSEYAVLYKSLSTDLDRQLGIGGAEKTILNRRTGEVLATARWYTLTRDGAPYLTCPSRGFDQMEMYVLGFGPQPLRDLIAQEIERGRREMRGK